MTFDTEIGEIRSDAEFRTFSDREHQKKLSPLINFPLMTDLVWDFPFEPMHGLDSGVGKKILTLSYDQGYLDQNGANLFITTLKQPKDFARVARPISQIKDWKASEFRLFALYYGAVMFMKHCKDDRVTMLMLLLFLSYRLLMGVNGSVSAYHRNLAQNFLNRFVVNFAEIFGAEQVSFNVHTLLHLPACVARFGPLFKFSAYVFENFYRLLKQWIRKAGKIEDYFKQILMRWIQTKGCVKKKPNRNKHFGYSILKATEGDSHVQLNDGRVFRIKEKTLTTNGLTFIGNVYTEYRNLFDTPMQSSELNIYLVSSLSEDTLTVNSTNLKCKMFKIKWRLDEQTGAEYNVVMPILHYQ